MDAVLCKDPADRHEDGQQADAIGILLVKALAGINPSHGGAAWRDDSEFARQHFQLRPLFLRNGSRAHEPKRPLKLCPGAFNPLHAGHLASTGENVIFHITADPPHKPALSLQDMLERSLQFRGVRDVLFTEGDALYIDKARRFPNSTFYVGTDVVERILDPRWGPQPEPMLREFAELGIHFAVSPRGGVRLADLTPKIPESCRSLQLFSELPQTPHADLSSTQIRNGAT
jgi:hypothetical protein